MILKVFAVRDMKAQAFLQPFYSPSIGSAVRAFSDAVNDKSCPFNKHPEDYVLYEIGVYDDNTSNLSSVNPINMLGCASDFVEVQVVPTGVDALKADSKFMDSVKDNKAVMDLINGKK